MEAASLSLCSGFASGRLNAFSSPRRAALAGLGELAVALGEEATIRISEKGEKRRTIGIHFAAVEAIGEYLKKAAIESGPMFRPRCGP